MYQDLRRAQDTAQAIFTVCLPLLNDITHNFLKELQFSYKIFPISLTKFFQLVLQNFRGNFYI
jgi:hypothetical protein